MSMVAHVNKISCSRIIGKAWATPRKMVTVVCIELQTAVAYAQTTPQMLGEIQDELQGHMESTQPKNRNLNK